MSDKAPRRFFQIHLSTTLVLMVLAAGLLGLNLAPREHNYGLRSASISGWPWTLCFHRVDKVEMTEAEERIFNDTNAESEELPEFRAVMEKLLSPPFQESVNTLRYRSFRLYGNIAVALGILTLAAVLLEWRLRRKTVSKEAAHG